MTDAARDVHTPAALLRVYNLRDIGGIAAAGGIVRRGLVYRSAALTDLAGEALAAVRALGIRTIVDLRRDAERAAFPTPWREMGDVDYWARDHDRSEADLRARMRAPDYSAHDARAAMIALYGALPYDQAESYARLFRAIAAGVGPVLFHCAVGKDRTGAAAALILAAAGVSRDAIEADYLATAGFDLPGSPHARGWPPPSPERAAAYAPLLGVDRAYLDAMFDAVTRRSGSLDAYLATTLALTPDEREAVRRNLVAPS